MNSVICPRCGLAIEVSEVLEHQLREKIESEQKAVHEKELERARDEAIAKAEQKSRSQFEFLIKTAREETKEAADQNRKLQEQLLDLTKELRLVKRDKEETVLTMERKLAEEEGRIRDQMRKKAEEEQQLRIAEYEKKLQDALKANNDLKRKLEQGSQQTQGEVLELELEEFLKREFPQDEIRPVPKGIRGADVLQEVKDRYGRSCGIILWESKNARWNDNWIGKLKDDQRIVKASISVLLSIELPKSVSSFGFLDGIWITGRPSLSGLAMALRMSLIREYFVRQSAVGKNEKMELMYQYLTGVEFRQRVEAITEAFSEMQEDMEKEKRWFTVKWAKQEKTIRKVIDATHGLYGDLQGVTGKALPEIRTLELSADSEIKLLE